MLDHPRHLDDATQLQLAPAPARGRLAQCLDEVQRLAAQVDLTVGQRAHLRGERLVRTFAKLLDVVNASVELVERKPDRRDELLDRLLAFLELALRALLVLAERLRREVEERFVVGLQRLRGKPAECRRQLLLRTVQHGQLLASRRALGVRRRLA